MMGFCYHSNEDVSLTKVEEFYRLFQRKYLKYSSGYNFSFQLDLFNNMSKGWLQNMILNTGKISLAQKILEVLAINPAITLHELVRKTGESDNEELKNILSYYTPIEHKPLAIGHDNIDDLLAGNIHIGQYDDWDILLCNVVIVRRNAKGTNIYELSLFGVMLVITLVYDIMTWID